MPSSFLVPIRLDALFLSNAQKVAEPLINYDRLPFVALQQDRHSETPFLGNRANSIPFHNDNLHLQAGVHLHWALPDALTKSIKGQSTTSFPRVPNRWMLTRRGANLPNKKWIVESDYLYPREINHLSGAVAIPYRTEGQEERAASFRYLGRKMPYAAWKAADSTGEYYEQLTALAYGDPNFASFYPNCHSVFGFHDREVNFAQLPQLHYELIGWYANESQDHLGQLIEKYIRDFKQKNKHAPSLEELETHLQQNLQWGLSDSFKLIVSKSDVKRATRSRRGAWAALVRSAWLEPIDSKSAYVAPFEVRAKTPIQDPQFAQEIDLLLRDKTESQFPRQTICLGEINFAPPADEAGIANPDKNDPDCQVVFGNTGTEALSAYLANEIDSTHSNQELEDQLEAVQLNTALEHRKVDLGAKFEEARHDKSFTAIDGGLHWTIRKETEDHSDSSAENADVNRKIELPSHLEIDQALHEVNQYQRINDQALVELKFSQQQLYADWCKYLESSYPHLFVDNPLPAPDIIKHFIETKSLPLVQQQALASVPLVLQKNRSGRIVAAAPEGGVVAPNTVRLAQAINQLLIKLQTFNQKQGLVANYKLDFPRPDKKVIDSSDHELDGQGFGDLTWVEDARFGSCLAFSGTNTSLRINIPTYHAVRALSFWIKPNNQQNGTRCLIDARPSLPKSNITKRQTGSAWNNVFLNGEVIDHFSWNLLVDQKWNHLYLETSQAFSGLLTLMANHIPKDFLAGHLAHLHLFSKALSTEEVEKDYKLYTPPTFTLQELPAPRYWQPNNPVALVVGKVAKVTARHGSDGNAHPDGLLIGEFLPEPNAARFDELYIKAVEQKAMEIRRSTDSVFAPQVWRHQPWHPLLMEWEIDMFPIRHKSNIGNTDRKFQTDFITDNYEMKENEVELSLRKDRLSIINNLSVYQGRSMLTPYSKRYVKEQIEQYLKRVLLHDFIADQNNNQVPDPSIAQLIQWYQQASIEPDANIKTPILNIITAYEDHLNQPDFHCLSQALGGYNDALLTQHLVMQTAVSDPLGFEEYQKFALQVKAAVGRENRLSPELNNDFSPIRAGMLKLNKLRLIDNFGRAQEVKTQTLIVPKRMEVENQEDMVFLAPRLLQAARINFRLLAAEASIESNVHPDSSPICGWLLPNHLDQSVMVYNASGNIKCSIILSTDSNNILQFPPGKGLSVPLGQKSDEILNSISNPALSKLIHYLFERQVYSLNNLNSIGGGIDLADSFLSHFLNALDTALANIDPESFAQHQDLALLIGRPIAVVRSSLDLALKTPPAIDQDAHSFRQDLNRNTREHEDFTHVEFPIRMGEYQQLNDGLVGYLIEEADSFKEDLFYAPQSDEIDDNFINTRSKRAFNLCQSIAGEAITLTMLVDPRGKIHATSGILPTKAIGIPSFHFEQALQNIEVTFYSSPILSDRGQLQLPLVQEAGFQWSWIGNEKGDWREISAAGMVAKAWLEKQFATAELEGAVIWDRLVEKGWIKDQGNGLGKIVPDAERTEQDLGQDLATQLDLILQLFASSTIGPIDPRANFSGQQVIREGWLKLSKED